jgi:hypothetical protein
MAIIAAGGDDDVHPCQGRFCVVSTTTGVAAISKAVGVDGPVYNEEIDVAFSQSAAGEFYEQMEPQPATESEM